MENYVLISNPGSASRKYALFAETKKVIGIHYEYEADKIIYGCDLDGAKIPSQPANLSHLTFTAGHLDEVFKAHSLNIPRAKITRVGVRIVAPSAYFQQTRLLDAASIRKLEKMATLAPLHINATLQEIHILRKLYPEATLVGLSDSAFHASIPEPAASYALPSQIIKKLDIRRFGYHGMSIESVCQQLKTAGKLPSRLVVAHLGSGASVTAVKNGQSIACSMGYSPLEGLMMSTRSGSLDVTAAGVMASELKLTDSKLQDILNNQSGLLGVSGHSSDIRELLKVEPKNPKAALALDMYVYQAQLHIGQMAAALGGIDALVFTGTVGERSSTIRQRIVQKLLFLGLAINSRKNHKHIQPGRLTQISPSANPAKIYIVPADEDQVMVLALLKYSK